MTTRRCVERTATWQQCSSWDAATGCHCAVDERNCSTVYRRRSATVVLAFWRWWVISVTLCELLVTTPALFSVIGCVPSALSGLQTASQRHGSSGMSVRTEPNKHVVLARISSSSSSSNCCCRHHCHRCCCRRHRHRRVVVVVVLIVTVVVVVVIVVVVVVVINIQ